MISRKMKMLGLASALCLCSLATIAVVNGMNPSYVEGVNDVNNTIQRYAYVEVAEKKLYGDGPAQEFTDGLDVGVTLTDNSLVFDLDKPIPSLNKNFCIHSMSYLKCVMDKTHQIGEESITVIINDTEYTTKVTDENYSLIFENIKYKNVNHIEFKSNVAKSNFLLDVIRLRFNYACEIGR